MTLSSKIETGIVLVSGTLLLLLLAGTTNNVLFAQEGLFDTAYHRQTITHDGPETGNSVDSWSEETPYLCSYFKMHSDGATGFHCTTGEYLKQQIFSLPNILAFFLFGLPLLVIFTGTGLVLIPEIKAKQL